MIVTTRHRDGMRISGEPNYGDYAPYQRMAAAIVTRAIRDWKKLCRRRITRSTEGYRMKLQAAEDELAELWEFFTGPWCEACCPYDVEILREKMLGIYEKSRLHRSIEELG